MVFNSLTFVVFFAIVLLLHNLPFGWQTKKFNLLMASYIFYASRKGRVTRLFIFSFSSVACVGWAESAKPNIFVITEFPLGFADSTQPTVMMLRGEP